jgi:sulfur-carrier protein
MIITLKYFGLIADLVNTHEEQLELSSDNCTSQELCDTLQSKYPGLVNTNFAIAVNQSIIRSVTPISNNDTIALLPPFAGG